MTLAVQHYTDAVTLDSTFADAWARLGLARMVQLTWGNFEAEVPRDSLPGLARFATDRALTLDSLSATAWIADGVLSANIAGDLSRSRDSFDRAVSLDSLSAEAFHWYGAVLGPEFFCDLEPAERLLRRALQLEPDRPNTWRHLARVLEYTEGFEAAEAIYDTTLALGAWEPAYLGRSTVRSWRGNAVGALADIAEAEKLVDSPAYDFHRAMAGIASGDSGPARGLWRDYRASDEDSKAAGAYLAARLGLLLGLDEEVLAILEEHSGAMGTCALLHDPVFETVRDDPRFLRLVEDLPADTR